MAFRLRQRGRGCGFGPWAAWSAAGEAGPGRAGDFSFTSQTGHCDEPWAKKVSGGADTFLSLISMA